MKDLKDPLDKKIQKYLEKKGRLTRCELGRPELNYYCNLAYKSKRGRLLCSAMIGWTKDLKVEGLSRCFLTARNEWRLKVAIKRNKDLKLAQRIQKRPK